MKKNVVGFYSKERAPSLILIKLEISPLTALQFRRYLSGIGE